MPESFIKGSWERMFQGCFKGVSWFSRVFAECFKEVSRKLSRCFEKVSCCISLMAASRAERGLVDKGFPKFTNLIFNLRGGGGGVNWPIENQNKYDWAGPHSSPKLKFSFWSYCTPTTHMQLSSEQLDQSRNLKKIGPFLTLICPELTKPDLNCPDLTCSYLT